jgi:hypothetical protein
MRKVERRKENKVDMRKCGIQWWPKSRQWGGHGMRLEKEVVAGGGR